MRYLTTVLLTLALAATSVALAETPRLKVIVSRGTAMVPVRDLAEFVEADIHYDASTATSTIAGRGAEIELRVGNRRALVNGVEEQLPAAPRIYRGRTHVPLRAVAEALGCKVTWDAAAGSGTISWRERVIRTGSADEASRRGDEVLQSMGPLHMASRNGEATTIARLLEQGHDVNEQAALGFTALHLAVLRGHTEAVLLLLQHGAEIDAQAKEGPTPLHMAVSVGRTETAELLLEQGADIQAQTDTGFTPLHTAAGQGQTEAARLLLEYGAEANAAAGELGFMTPLFVAAARGHTETVELLREHGAR